MFSYAHALPQFLTMDECTKLLDLYRGKSSATATRNHLSVCLLLFNGLRSGELLGLEPSQINVKSDVLIIRGKGRRWRSSIVNDETKTAYTNWMAHRGRLGLDSNRLICTLSNNAIDGKNFRESVKRMGRRAGLGERLHPHLLRHTHATLLYAQTNDLLLVQRSLGHASAVSTQIYAHLVNGKLENAIKNMSLEPPASD